MDDSRNEGRRPVLVVLATLSTVALVWGVTVAWRRFVKRQFPEGEVKPTGWLATAMAKTAPWLGGWLYTPVAKRLHLAADDEVLDVACGSGAFLRKYASHVRRFAGLDHSDDLIAFAKRENQERIAEFSVVTCNCIDCFAAKTRPALEEMYRVLRPGGRILVADDHGQEMEEIGFSDVAVEHVLWGYCTTASKQAA